MRKEAIDPLIFEEAKRCALSIKNGEILIFPSETLWGIGCSALNKVAIEKINLIKKRSEGKSFISLVSSWRMLQNVVKIIPPVAEELIEVTDRPITIVYPEANDAFKHLCSENGEIAVRLIESGFPFLMIEKAGQPVISTSANISGNASSESLSDIPEEIIASVDYIANEKLNYNLSGKASSIIKVELNGSIKILR